MIVMFLYLTLTLSECDLSACLVRLEHLDYELESSIARLVNEALSSLPITFRNRE